MYRPITIEIGFFAKISDEMNKLHYNDAKNRDVNYAYGSLMQRAIWQSFHNVSKPILISNSFFIGSQKYGAYLMPSDNKIENNLIQILINSISGFWFGTVDTPETVASIDFNIQFY